MGYFYPPVSWKVIIIRGSQDIIKFYNVFHHADFIYDVCRALTERISREQISEKIMRSAQYYFWSKGEWEIIVSNWPRQDVEEKIDVFDQLEANWDNFIDYIIKNRKPLIRWYKESRKYAY